MAKWDKFGTDFDEERGIKKKGWSEFYDDFETVKDKLYQEYQQKVSGIVKTNNNKKLYMNKWNNYRDMVEVYCDAKGTSSLKERKFYSDTEGRSPLEALRMHLEAGGPWANPQEMMEVMDVFPRFNPDQLKRLREMVRDKLYAENFPHPG